MRGRLVGPGIWRKTALAVVASVCGLHSFAGAQEATNVPAVIEPAQDLRQGSNALLLAVRATILAEALADEQRSKETGSYTSVSFPLPTCVFAGGACGAINRDGSIAVAPQFDWVDKFYEGRTRVRLAGRYGYVDETGRLVVPPRYEIAGSFWRGVAEVDVGGKSALIDPEGREVLAPRFARAHPFTRDVFWVLEGTRRYDGRPGMAEFANYVDWDVTYDVSGAGRWGLVDRTGAWIRQPDLTSIRVFDRNDDSLVLAKAETGWGVIKPDGSWHIEPKFERLGPIGSDGFVPAKIRGKAGFIDRAGTFVIEPTFDDAGYFAEDGLARAAIGKLYGLIDRSGNWVIEPKYEWLAHGRASDRGLIWFRADKRWGAIDRSGRRLVDPIHSQIGATVCEDGWVLGYVDGKQRAVRRADAPLPMPDGNLFGRNCDGPLRIQVGDKFGYVDRALTPITAVEFESASDFFRDTAVVKINGKFGYIRQNGSWLIEPRFEEAQPMGDIAIVKLDGKFGCIRPNGTWLIEPHFAERPWLCGNRIAQIAGKFGHEKPDGSWHIEPQLEKTVSFTTGYVAVKIDGKFGVIDASGAWVIHPRWRTYGMNLRAGAVAARFDDKWGFIDASGAMIIEPKYDGFSIFERGIAWVKTGSTWCAIDRRGQSVLGQICQDIDPNPRPGTSSMRTRW